MAAGSCSTSADQLLGVGSVMAGQLRPGEGARHHGRGVTAVEPGAPTCAACRRSGRRRSCMGVFDGVHRGHQALLGATSGRCGRARRSVRGAGLRPAPRRGDPPGHAACRASPRRPWCSDPGAWRGSRAADPLRPALREHRPRTSWRPVAGAIAAGAGDDPRRAPSGAGGAARWSACASTARSRLRGASWWNRCWWTASRSRRAGCARQRQRRPGAVAAPRSAGLPAGHGGGGRPPRSRARLSDRQPALRLPPALPPLGVYTGASACRNGAWARTTRRWSASARGRPSTTGRHLLVEVHLLDYDGDLYGAVLELELLHRLRDERRFASAEELVTQMHRDEAEARARLGLG